MGGLTIKGNGSVSATNPQDLSAAQVLNILGASLSGGGLNGGVIIPTPQGNVIVNWGFTGSISGNSTLAVNFNVNYTTNYSAVATGNGGAVCMIFAQSNSQLTLKNVGGSAQNCFWVSIGG
jgi:hypothetical protein